MLYLALPTILFAYGWLRWPFAVISILLLCVSIGIAAAHIFRALRTRGADEVPARSALWVTPALLLIAIWLAFSGAGGFGFQNPDHHASNALLRDLIRQEWPITLVLRGVRQNVVYYVGYYLLAAGIGKLLGWAAANVFIFLWTALGVYLAFCWFRAVSRVDPGYQPVRLLWLALIFCLAGGLDTVATLIKGPPVPDLTVHVEPWAGFFEYSSASTLLYWVPQQAIAGWLMTGVVVAAYYEPLKVGSVAMSLAAGMLWSPLALTGLVPFIVLLLCREFSSGRKRLEFNRESVLLTASAVWVAAMHGTYLASNRYSFAVSFIWDSVGNLSVLLPRLIGFWLIEFGVLASVTILHLALGSQPDYPSATDSWIRTRLNLIEQKYAIMPRQLTLFAMSALVLVILPLFKLGYLNDLAMRASIPSLFILQAFAAKVLLDAKFDRPAIRFSVWIRLTYLVLLAVLVVSFLPALSEIGRSVRFGSFAPPLIESVPNSADANPTVIVEQRLGNDESFYYRFLGK